MLWFGLAQIRGDEGDRKVVLPPGGLVFVSRQQLLHPLTCLSSHSKKAFANLKYIPVKCKILCTGKGM